MSFNLKLYTFFSTVLMVLFFVVKTSTSFNLLSTTQNTNFFEYFCFLLYIPLFYLIIKELLKKQKENKIKVIFFISIF